eukprot:scaffold10322_cov117-Isochrysis_galbana.AAC.1
MHVLLRRAHTSAQGTRDVAGQCMSLLSLSSHSTPSSQPRRRLFSAKNQESFKLLISFPASERILPFSLAAAERSRPRLASMAS